jgi:hypothetical protein
MNRACQAKYGSTSRLATSLEIAESNVTRTELMQAGGGSGWVQPWFDANGREASGVVPAPNACQMWSNSTLPSDGLIVGVDVAPTLVDCTATRAAACSVPLNEKPRYRFAGFTNATTPHLGYGRMNETCQAEFGPTSRMAFHRELFDAAPMPALSGTAWVKASITDFEYSARMAPRSCFASNPVGFLVDADLRTTEENCSFGHRVACSITP